MNVLQLGTEIAKRVVMKNTQSWLLALALTAGGVGMLPSDVSACGGCFAPPGAAQVVTDHRMVLSLSDTQTTLWDQFQYSGSPEEFSWILPIRYTDATRVELASDDFLTLMANVSVPAMQQPTPPGYEPGCVFPAPPSGGFADAGTRDVASRADSGVVVLREEVVGPYAVAIVRGTTSTALRDWLRSNGYSVPAAVEPVIDYYLGINMDFVALRLRAGKGLNRMAPVRVTMAGYQPRLPLRMIAAGVADRVGLSLTVFAASRVEAMNFPNAEFTDDDFTYDWNTPPRDLGGVFLSAFNARNRAMSERLWLTESSMQQERDSLESLALSLPSRTGFVPFGRDGGTPDAGRARTSPADDVTRAFMGIGETATVTRFRADLPARMLDRDLEIGSSDRGMRDRSYRFGRELNRPPFQRCPFPVSDSGTPPTTDIGTPPRIDSGISEPPMDAGTDGGTVSRPVMASGGVSCTVQTPGSGRSNTAAILASLGVAVVAIRRRFRR
jgi:hypothetical protein